MFRVPRGLILAAIAQAAEAAVLCAATALSGIALTAIGAGTTIALAAVARGLAQGRRWSRTPALLTQLFTGIVAVYLLQGHRLDWGLPTAVLAVAGFAGLLNPS